MSKDTQALLKIGFQLAPTILSLFSQTLTNEQKKDLVLEKAKEILINEGHNWDILYSEISKQIDVLVAQFKDITNLGYSQKDKLCQPTQK